MYTTEEIMYLKEDLRNYIKDPFSLFCCINIIEIELFNNCESLLIVQKVIKFIVNSRKRKNLNRLVFSTPLENMPLYINDLEYKGCFARWRLKIGK